MEEKMPTTIDDYWSKGSLTDREKRFRAIMEVYPVKDLKVQLLKLKEIIEEVLEENKNMIKEEEEAIRTIKGELERLLSQKEVSKDDFDYISQLIFNGAKMSQSSFLGLL